MLVVILLLGGYETYKRWQARGSGDERILAFYKVKPAHRIAIATVYLALIAVCAIGMELTLVQQSLPS
jgi:hypothetical protein